MNKSTGEFYELRAGESMRDFATRTGALRSDLVEVARLPDGRCRKCDGRGSIRAGLNSKRFKPCVCVL